MGPARTGDRLGVVWLGQHVPALHRSILVVDVEKFSDRADNHQREIHAGLYEVLERAFAESAIPWRRCQHEDRGDGVLVLVPPEVPKAKLIDHFPQRLIAELRRYNATRNAHSRIRLRMALHAGEVFVESHGVTGTAVNLTFRLVDAAQLRTALGKSTASLAMIVSDSWYRDVIAQDPAMEPAAYLQIVGQGKRISFQAWIRLPDDPGFAAMMAALPSADRDGPPEILAPRPILAVATRTDEPAEGVPAAQPATKPTAAHQPQPLRPLVEALEHVPLLGGVDGRRLCVRMLTRRLGPSFRVGEYATGRHQLYELVLACERQPDGLSTLVDVLDELGAVASVIGRLRALVGELAVLDLLPTTTKRRLLALLARQEWPNAVAAYRTAAGLGTAVPPAGARDPGALFAALEQRNARPDGIPPALLFVELLAVDADRGLATELRAWTAEWAESMGLGDELRTLRDSLPDTRSDTRLDTRAGARHGPRRDYGRGEIVESPVSSVITGSPPAYLVIRIQRDALDANRYLMRHWCQLGPVWQPWSGDDFTGSLEAIEDHVAELLAETEGGWAADAELIRLEFVLPRDLLGLPVDRWARGVNGEPPQVLGLRYQLAVRSLERMRTTSWHRDWRRRWRELTQLMSTNSAPLDWRVLWAVSNDARQLRRLDVSLTFREEVLSVLLGRPIPPDTEISADEIVVALRAGVPIIMWCRDGRVFGDFESTALDLFAFGADRLLENVRTLRGAAFAADDPDGHVGSHLTVLWDDPDRLVEPAALPRAPRRDPGG